MAVLKKLILTVSTLGRCGSLERTDFNSFYFGGCGSLERTDFNSSTLGRCGGVDRTDFNNIYPWKGVMLLKQLILTVSTWRGCGSLEKTDFNSFYFGKVWQS